MAIISKTLSILAENDGQIVNVNWTANEEVLNYFQHTFTLTTTYTPIFESNVQTGNRTFNIKNLRVENLSDISILLKIYHQTGNPTFVVIITKGSFVLSTLLSDNSTTAGGENIIKIEASSSVATAKLRVVQVS
jgi:hypothetical protein